VSEQLQQAPDSPEEPEEKPQGSLGTEPTIAPGASSGEAETSLVGRVLDDRYEVLRALGQGAMGAVYEVRHLRLDKRFAMKVIHGELARVPEFVARFEREAMACSRMDHPCTISVTDFGQASTGELFLVMELVEGRSIEELVQEGPLPLEPALEVTRQILLALQHAHAAGVIHRDIKPENVMRVETDDGIWRVKVLDFGIAKAPAGGQGGQLTQAGVVFGTPQYMAPEQAVSTTVDARADLYAAGATLWRMLTGKPLFDGEGPVEILSAKLSRPPPDLEDHAPGVYAPALVAFLRRSLARKPSERFASADEMLAALAQIQEAEGGGLATRGAAGAWLARGRAAGRTIARRLGPHASTLATRIGELYTGWYCAPPGGWPQRLRGLVTTTRGRQVLGLSLGAAALLFLLVILPSMFVVDGALEQPGPEAPPARPGAKQGGSWVRRLIRPEPEPDAVLPEVQKRLTSVRVLLEKGACREASVELLNLLREHTRLAEAHYLLGATEICQRHPESALASYSKAIALDPRYRGDVRIRQHLEKLLASRKLALQAVEFINGSLGAEGLPLLVQTASAGKDLDARHRAVALVAKAGAAARIDWIASLSLDLEQLPTCEERCKVVERLEALGKPEAVPVLRRARDASVRYHIFRKRWRNGCCRKRIIAAIKKLVSQR